MRQSQAVAVSWVRRIYATGKARQIRKDSHLSLADIAAVAEVERSTVSRWERGITKPGRDHALRVAYLLAELQEGDL